MTIVKRERGEQVATLPNYPSANNLKTDERKERTQSNPVDRSCSQTMWLLKTL